MTDPTLDEDILRQWIGRAETRACVIDAEPARRMQATLDRQPGLSDGDALPPLWTWFYFLDNPRDRTLERDGRTVLGDFLPPVALPRRMWAGGRFRFEAPLRLGEAAERTSEIADVRVKQGRTGALCFITARHTYGVGGETRITEEHDMVYRADPGPNDPRPAPPAAPKAQPGDAIVGRVVTPTPLILFRYSALTFNGHRIHYDRDYARDVEGYPDLVVHGPLTATLLADLALQAEPHGRLAAFDYRAVSPLYDDGPFRIRARRAVDEAGTWDLWAENASGGLAMTATATFG
ncbi:MAG: MaoC family dehydratase N-terminal domain-containing protein [Rhodospirillales bacterium]